MTEQELKFEIGKILYKAEIYPNLKGYYFLKELIFQKAQNTQLTCKDLLNNCAAQFNTNSGNIQSLVRHALKKATDNGSITMLNKQFNVDYFSTKTVMPVYEFICIVSELIQDNMREVC